MRTIRASTLTPDQVDAAADGLRRLAAAARAEHRSVETNTVIEVIQPVTLPTAWLTSTEAADILGVSRNTAKKWARTGYLRGSRRDPEGWWRIPRASVERVAQVESEFAPASTSAGIDRSEIRRAIRMTDRDRETYYLGSNRNMLRMFGDARSSR